MGRNERGCQDAEPQEVRGLSDSGPRKEEDAWVLDPGREEDIRVPASEGHRKLLGSWWGQGSRKLWAGSGHFGVELTGSVTRWGRVSVLGVR